MKNIFKTFFLFLLLSPGMSESVPTVRIGYQPSSAILLVGKAKGIYEKEFAELGVKVQWDLFLAGPLATEAAASDRIDIFSIGNMPPIAGRSGGIDVVIIGKAAFNPATNAVMVSANSPIKTLQDLKGKKIAAQIGSSVHYFLYQLLTGAGLSMDDVQLVNLNAPDQGAALESGAVDAVVSWMPYRTQLEKAGKARAIANSAKVPGSYSFYAARGAFGKEHPEWVEAFLKATQETNRYVKNHKTETLKVLAQESHFPPDVLADSLKGFDYSMRVSEKEIGVMDDIKKFLLTNHVIRKDFPIHDLFNDSYAQKAGVR